jgi:hypothetical protein
VILLLALDDPETAFRSPPLSTKQLFSPAAYLASDRPIRLLGALPSLPGCKVVQDETFGVLRLLLGLSAAGASVRGESLGRWKGDRFVQLTCDDGRAPWIYVAQFSGETAPRDFEAELDALLPRNLARPVSSTILGPRISAWSGLDPELATAFARGLAPHEVHDFGEWLP